MIITVPSIMTAISVIGVLSILGAIALFISHILKKEHEFQEKERATFTQYETIIKRAHEDAASLLEKATQTSQTLISQTKTTNERLASDFDKILQQIAQKQIEAMNSEAEILKHGYQNKVNQMQSTIDQNTNTMMQTTEVNLDKQLAVFTQTLMSHATKSEQMISQKTQEMLQKIELELETYKKTKMQNVDHEILQLIQKTYQEILGRSIPPTVQRELILEALEKSKKEGLFTL
jgi:hypothetical protein